MTRFASSTPIGITGTGTSWETRYDHHQILRAQRRLASRGRARANSPACCAGSKCSTPIGITGTGTDPALGGGTPRQAVLNADWHHGDGHRPAGNSLKLPRFFRWEAGISRRRPAVFQRTPVVGQIHQPCSVVGSIHSLFGCQRSRFHHHIRILACQHRLRHRTRDGA